MTNDLHTRLTQTEYRLSQAETKIDTVSDEVRTTRHGLAGKVQEVVNDVERHDVILTYVKERLDQIAGVVTGQSGGLSRLQGGIVVAAFVITCGLTIWATLR